MGIEPTCDAVNTPHNGFEDRGHHQVCKHFRTCLGWGLPSENNSLYGRSGPQPSGDDGRVEILKPKS